MAARHRWTPDVMRAELEPVATELGRMAAGGELAAGDSPGSRARMQRHGGVAMWRERTTAAMPSGEVAVTGADIARQAYCWSLERDGGYPVAHWLDAERELSEAVRR